MVRGNTHSTSTMNEGWDGGMKGAGCKDEGYKLSKRMRGGRDREVVVFWRIEGRGQRGGNSAGGGGS